MQNLIPTRVEKLSGPTVVGKIDLPAKKEPKKKPVASSKDNDLILDQKRKRKRIKKDAGPVDFGRSDREPKKTRVERREENVVQDPKSMRRMFRSRSKIPWPN